MAVFVCTCLYHGGDHEIGTPACRAYGCDAPVGLVYGINPFMIIFMVPLVGALTTKFAHFDMIHYGSYVSALSPFWIVAFPTHGAPASCSSSPNTFFDRHCFRIQKSRLHRAMKKLSLGVIYSGSWLA